MFSEWSSNNSDPVSAEPDPVTNNFFLTCPNLAELDEDCKQVQLTESSGISKLLEHLRKTQLYYNWIRLLFGSEYEPN